MAQGEVASAAAVGPPPGMKVRLSSNESPFGPSPAVVDVLRDRAAEVHLYPDDQSTGLRAALAQHEGTPIERVAAGNGSAALLMDLIAHECLAHEGPNEATVLTYERAFIVYRLGAQSCGARFVEAPLGDGFTRDPAALLDRVDDDTRIVLIDNPSNPTGRHFAGDDLRELVAAVPEHVTVAVDEAYHHFAEGHRGYASIRDLDLDHPRVVVLRTFSKAYALAGLRCGYLIGSEDLVRSLEAFRVRFNVNGLAQAAAIAALGDVTHLERTITGTLAGRQRMADGLRELGVPFVDGLGNFLLLELGQPSGPVVAAYAEQGVGVRPLAPYRLDEHIRVTVGTPEEVDAFLDATRVVLGEDARR